MREHPEQQRLVGLARAEQADVGSRRRRQQAAQRVQGLGADRRLVDAVGVVRGLRVARAEVILHRRDPFRVGLERAVHRGDEAIVQRAAGELGGDVILPAAARFRRVGDVARGLLEVRHQPAPLEHLREEVRHALAGQVGAAELRHRVVSVFVEDAGVEAVGAVGPDRGPRRPRLPGADLAEELVEEQPPHGLRGSRVAREQRALDRLGKVDQREDGPVGVREVRRERALFVGCEGIDAVF